MLKSKRKTFWVVSKSFINTLWTIHRPLTLSTMYLCLFHFGFHIRDGHCVSCWGRRRSFGLNRRVPVDPSEEVTTIKVDILGETSLSYDGPVYLPTRTKERG